MRSVLACLCLALAAPLVGAEKGREVNVLDVREMAGLIVASDSRTVLSFKLGGLLTASVDTELVFPTPEIEQIARGLSGKTVALQGVDVESRGRRFILVVGIKAKK